MRGWALIGLAGLGLTAWSEAAWACPGMLCVDGYLYPAGRQVPIGTQAILWRPNAPYSYGLDEVTATLTRVDSGAEVPFEVAHYQRGLVLTFAQPLAQGAYRFVDPGVCAGPTGVSGFTADFVVDGHADLPLDLGTLLVEQQTVGAVQVEASAQCSVDVPSAFADLRVAPSEGARPWAALLLYRTLVDGVQWRPNDFAPRELPVGGSWRGRGSDTVFAMCGEVPSGVAQYGLTQGLHIVVMQATLPGTNILLETDPVEVDLTCSQTSVPDAGVADDAGVPADGGEGVGSGGGLAGVEDGCTCQHFRPGRSGLGWLLGLLLALPACRTARRLRSNGR